MTHTELAAHVALQEAHLKKLAGIPGWREYAEKKAEAMAKDQPTMYGHLPQLVADEINLEKAK